MKKNHKIIFERLKFWIDPEQVFTMFFADSPNTFWLDSSLSTNDYSRFSYMGVSSEIVTYSIATKELTIDKHEKKQKLQQDIFSYLKDRMAKNYCEEKKLPFDFIGGYVGYFGYELKSFCGGKETYKSHYPDSLWFLVDKTIVFDHKEKNIYLVCFADKKTNAGKWFAEIKNKLQDVPLPAAPYINIHTDKTLIFRLDRNYKKYIRDIAICKEYLQKGDSYEICLTNTITTKTNLDHLKLYQSLRKNNPAPYSAYLKHNDLSVLSSSPEQFLSIDKNRTVLSKPIKGTIRRGQTLQIDEQLKRQLLESEKEKAENLMIVDLVRNDLGRVCEIGSISVPKLMDIESYQTVHQLVSTVKGKLRRDISPIDCIISCFPGGSMTGAPKIRTMEIIDKLEKKTRGIYSGSIGFLSFNKTVSLNIAIRTIVAKNDEFSMGSGGAILIQSDPEKEYDEMLLKTKILLQTLTTAKGSKDYKIIGDRKMHKVFLALGSNVGDKKRNIKQAVEFLRENIKKITLAPIYETIPMYYENQDSFENTVLRGYTTFSPQELLKNIKQIEKQLGRKKRFRNGPREIDIDILFYDNLVYKDKDLQIPHPRIQERGFVLKPFYDLEPSFVHPVLQKTIKELK